MDTSLTPSPYVSPVKFKLDLEDTNVSGPMAGKAEVVVDHFPFLLGRHPECDCVLFSRQVSRRHCQFSQRDEQIWVEDLHSYNGTYLNKSEILEPVLLQDGDTVAVRPFHYRCNLNRDMAGNWHLRLILTEAEQPAAAMNVMAPS